MAAGDVTGGLPPDLAARLAALDVLPGVPDDVSELPGGLTNRNFLVHQAGKRFVARFFDDSGAALAIDREAEFRNTRRAAATGVAPDVLAYDPRALAMAIAYVPGATLTGDDVRDPAQITRIAASVRRLHTAATFDSDFDMFAVQRRYLATAQARGFPLPDRYTEFMPRLDEIATVLAMHPQPLVPCHNDLLAENFVDDGSQVWIIDFEYAGNNDPCFEIGNLASESHLDADITAALTTAYFQRDDPVLLARVQLFGLLAQYGWTLWGTIQQQVSSLGLDLSGWIADRWDRALATFTGPDYHRLLSAAGAHH